MKNDFNGHKVNTINAGSIPDAYQLQQIPDQLKRNIQGFSNGLPGLQPKKNVIIITPSPSLKVKNLIFLPDRCHDFSFSNRTSLKHGINPTLKKFQS